MLSIALARRYVTVLVAAIAAAYAAWSLAPEWHAGWQLMDDWAVLAQAGPDQRLSKAEFLAAIDTSEAAHPGADARYRPALVTLHLLEAAVLGTGDPGAWFRWRTAQWAFVLATFAGIIVSWSGVLPGLAISAYLATQYYWRDIWAHLFLSEPWCAVGSAIFALGWHRSRYATLADASVATAALGLAIAAGSKENFLLLAPVLAWMAWKAWREARLHAAGILVSTAGLLYCGGIVVAVLLGSARVGHDTYGNSTGLGARLAFLTQPFPLVVVASTALGALLVLGVRRFARERGVETTMAVDGIARGLLAVVAAAAVLILSQYAFYAGKWPTFGGRFDFPGRLTDVMILTGAAWAWRRAERAGLIRPAAARIGRWTLSLLVTALAMRHVGSLRAAARDTAENSRALHAVIESVASAVSRSPGAPVLLMATRDQEEPTISLVVFLSQRLPGHPIFVASAEPPRATHQNDEAALALQRLVAGWKRRPGAPPPALRPLSEFGAARAVAGSACAALEVRDYSVPRILPGCDPPGDAAGGGTSGVSLGARSTLSRR